MVMNRAIPRLQAISRSLRPLDFKTQNFKPHNFNSFHTSPTFAMRAVIYDKTGDSSVLHVGDIPKPAAGPSDALVKIDYAGINFIGKHGEALWGQPFVHVLGHRQFRSQERQRLYS